MARTARRALAPTLRREQRKMQRAGKRGTRLVTVSARLAVDDVASIPDLLNLEPRMSLDAGQICGAIDFAFAGGSSGETLERAFDACALSASDFNPACFASDLYVSDFVKTCLPFSIDGSAACINASFLTRVLCNPPRDMDEIALRRGVLEELWHNDALRRSLERLYRATCKLEALLSVPATPSRYEATRRRIDAMSLIKDIVGIASAGFGDAQSALARIDAFAREVIDSDGYRHVIELLDYENELAKVDVRIQVGVDGRVRRLDIIRVDENEQNSFYTTPWGRFIGKIALWWRGYRFSNDELVDRWLDLVFEGVSHFLPALVQLRAHAELYLAMLAFADRCTDSGLDVSFATLSSQGDGRMMRGLFNPLLFAQGVVPTPCDIDSADAAAITIVTGPNSGGKTRLLQALGLTQILAQSGMFVPARAARLPLASGMFVSLIDDHSVDQKEGRLGTELIRIRELFETARRGALIIVDELCSGTNPSEGEEIFYLVLTLLRELAPEAFITTHFLTFARRLSDDDELALLFLQVELDDHQRPTYGFVPGVATTSLAAQTAARLGVTREELMSLVRRHKR